VSWPLVKLSEVCTLINGRAYSQGELLSKGKYEVLRVGNFFSNRDWYYSDLELPEEKYCDNGDLLYAWSASFGPRIWDGGKVIYHYHIWKVVIDEALVDKKYLFYALQYDVESIKREQGSGSTMIHVTKSAMENRLVPLPPLPEQKRIAAILDKAEAIRRKRQQAIQLADDFLRAVFLDMFGDPVTNPKGWEVDALEQLSTRVTKGESPKWQGFEYGSEGVRFITSENVLWGSLDERMKYIPLEFHQKLKRSQVQEGDLLINLVGASVGRACLAELNGVPANINQAVSVTTLDHSRLLPEIALYQLLVPSMQRVLLGNVVDAARANISLADIRDLQMLVPPTDVQLAFLKVLGKVKKYMAVNSSFSGLNLFESLSHNAFSGQL